MISDMLCHFHDALLIAVFHFKGVFDCRQFFVFK